MMRGRVFSLGERIGVGDRVEHVIVGEEYDRDVGVVVDVREVNGRVMYKVAWGKDLRNWHYDVELERSEIYK